MPRSGSSAMAMLSSIRLSNGPRSGSPNARYWALKLLKDTFAPGDSLVRTSVDSGSVHARGFVTKGGARKVLLVNKRDRDVGGAVSDLGRGSLAFVDGSTPDGIGP